MEREGSTFILTRKISSIESDSEKPVSEERSLNEILENQLDSLEKELIVGKEEELALFKHLAQRQFASHEIAVAYEGWLKKQDRVSETVLEHEVDNLIRGAKTDSAGRTLLKLNQYKNALRFCLKKLGGNEDLASRWLKLYLADKGIDNEETLLEDVRAAIAGLVKSDCKNHQYTSKQRDQIVQKLNGFSLSEGKLTRMVNSHMEEQGYVERKGFLSKLMK